MTYHDIEQAIRALGDIAETEAKLANQKVRVYVRLMNALQASRVQSRSGLHENVPFDAIVRVVRRSDGVEIPEPLPSSPTSDQLLVNAIVSVAAVAPPAD
jgi:hypothetical protein